MAGNLFFLKGWALTLIAALFSFFIKDTNYFYLLIIYSFIIIFWILDGYFLSKERSFRNLYNYVRKLDEEKINFSMNIDAYKNGKNSWINSMFSMTLLLFYLPIIIVIFLITYLIN